jgi:hypothetical protein
MKIIPNAVLAERIFATRELPNLWQQDVPAALEDDFCAVKSLLISINLMFGAFLFPDYRALISHINMRMKRTEDWVSKRMLSA